MNDPRSQKNGFGLFDLLERLDTAYCNRTECFPTFGKVQLQSFSNCSNIFKLSLRAQKNEILALITCLNQFLASYTCLVFLPDWIFAIFKQGAFVQVHSHN